MTTAASIESMTAKPFVNARLVQVRLVSEHVDSAPARSTEEPKPVQLRTETTTTFGVALDHPMSPTGALIQVDYTVTIKLEGTGIVVADYKGKNTAEFKILDWGGFQDWAKPSQAALVPYFAMAHNAALRRAQRTLLDMGLGQVILPVLSEFPTEDPSSEATS